MLLDKGTFQKRRKTIPKHALKAQARFKKAMRNATSSETHEFRFDQIVAAAISGDMKRAGLYRFRQGWDVSHREPLSSLIHTYLRQNDICWEDMTVRAGTCWLAEPHLSRWQNWHRSYTEKHDNLFLQPKDLNRREPRMYFDLPSREFGSF